MTEFEIDGVKYRCRKLSGFAQLNIARRMIPILPALKGTIETTISESVGGEMTGGQIIDSIAPVADAISGLADEDVNYVIAQCLMVIDRNSGPGWQAVWNISAGRSQFDDVQTNGWLMLQLAAKVIQDNVMSFFPALRSASNGAAGLTQNTSPST